MKLTSLLLFNTLLILFSCSGQTAGASKSNKEPKEFLSVGDTVSELGKNLMIVFQDQQNNYWFGGDVDGVYRYDGKTIMHFTTEDGLADMRIDEIKEDKLGNVYFTTGKGISLFNGKTFNTLKEIDGGDSDWKLEQKDLWFKSSEYSGYVFRYDGKDLYKLKMPATKLGEDYRAKHPNNPDPYGIYTIYKDSKGNIWFGTGTLGVCRYNGKYFDWISEVDVAELHDGPANGVRSIVEDASGNFWFNTEYLYNVYGKRNVSKRDRENGIFYLRTKSIGSLDEKNDGDLKEYLSITKDNNNDLWIATYNTGVWKYDGSKITHYPVQVNSKNISLYSIYKDKHGDLWLGTHENGTFKFNGQNFEAFK